MSKGGARPGAGRPKGQANKRTQAIQERLEELQCDPIEGMAMIANDMSLDHSLRLAAMKELAQYVAPKRKAVDMATTFDGSVNIEVVKFSEIEKQEAIEEDDDEDSSSH
tara:strand:- start:21173 stop:21499 length:327 start_codon:yes stop_codon:yes gene_type:complete